MRQVTGLFENAQKAKDAVDDLVEASFPSDDVSLLLLDREGGAEPRGVGQKTGVSAGAMSGAAAGSVLGVALAFAGLVPGFGLLAAGPALAALQGLTAGTAAGSLVGALAGLSWWKAEADIPAADLERGAVIVGVAVPDGRVGEALEVLRAAGATQVHMA